MTENFIDKYNEEVSESSIVTEEEIAGKTNKTDKPPSATKPDTRKREQLNYYTFDPKSVLKETERPAALPKYPKPQTETLGYKPAYNSPVDYTYRHTKKPGSYSSSNSVTATFAQRPQDMSYLTVLGDDFRKTDDYRGFSKEFEKEFGNDQKEMEYVSNELKNRTAKLDNFIKELQNADVDMILFRTRLVREIQDVQNDLKEAYNNILVLMGDRSNMKDQFCVFKMKIKKLKGFVKTFQDDIQAYHCFVRIDVTYQ
jgi:hypothetical protein